MWNVNEGSYFRLIFYLASGRYTNTAFFSAIQIRWWWFLISFNYSYFSWLRGGKMNFRFAEFYFFWFFAICIRDGRWCITRFEIIKINEGSFFRKWNPNFLQVMKTRQCTLRYFNFVFFFKIWRKMLEKIVAKWHQMNLLKIWGLQLGPIPLIPNLYKKNQKKKIRQFSFLRKNFRW